MTALPVIMLFVMGRTPVSAQDMEEMGRVLRNPVFTGMNPTEAIQSSLSSFMMILFLMMPLMVPVTIAAYSIVGEKVTRSLEPLLAAPITTSRLLLAKGLAAAIPGIGMAWICYGLFLICARFLATSDRVFAFFVDPMWLIAMFILAPLLTILAVNVGIIVSSRTSDPRAAEQLGSLVVLPLMVLLFGPMLGLIMLNSTTFWICSAIVALIDVGLIYLGVLLFQRETILTRWK
jgi:ABC-2 type transport system permease protein